MDLSVNTSITLTHEQQKSNNASSDPRLIEIIKKIKSSSDKSIQVSGLCELRVLLSESNDSLEQDIDQDLIFQLIQFLNDKEDLEIQVESSSIISLICSKNIKVCHNINQSKALDPFINALDLENQVVLENVLCTLNSLLAEDSTTRKIYLENNSLQKVSLIFEKHPIPPIKKHLFLFMSNILKPKPYPQWEEIEPLVPILREVIQGMTDGETLPQALDCAAAISDTDHTAIQNVIDLGFVPHLIQHVYNKNEDIFVPALRVLGNIITGDDQQTNKILAHPNFLIRLFELIMHSDQKIQKEVVWILSNIAAGTEKQKKQIINGPNYMNALKHALNQGDQHVSLEASWVYANLVNGCSLKLVNDLINKYEYLECISLMLSKKNRKINHLALETLSSLLSEGKGPSIQKIVDSIEKDLADHIRTIPSNTKDQNHLDEILGKLADAGFDSIELNLDNENPDEEEAVSNYDDNNGDDYDDDEK